MYSSCTVHLQWLVQFNSFAVLSHTLVRYWSTTNYNTWINEDNQFTTNSSLLLSLIITFIIIIITNTSHFCYYCSHNWRTTWSKQWKILDRTHYIGCKKLDTYLYRLTVLCSNNVLYCCRRCCCCCCCCPIPYHTIPGHVYNSRRSKNDKTLWKAKCVLIYLQ